MLPVKSISDFLGNNGGNSGGMLRERIGQKISRVWTGTALDILMMEDLPACDRLAIATHPGWLPAVVVRKFAILCACESIREIHSIDNTPLFIALHRALDDLPDTTNFPKYRQEFLEGHSFDPIEAYAYAAGHCVLAEDNAYEAAEKAASIMRVCGSGLNALYTSSVDEDVQQAICTRQVMALMALAQLWEGRD